MYEAETKQIVDVAGQSNVNDGHRTQYFGWTTHQFNNTSKSNLSCIYLFPFFCGKHRPFTYTHTSIYNIHKYIYMYIYMYISYVCVYIYIHMTNLPETSSPFPGQMPGNQQAWFSKTGHTEVEGRRLLQNFNQQGLRLFDLSPLLWLWVQSRYPKWNPSKGKHGPKPAVPWWFNFDPYSCILLGKCLSST